MKINGTNNIANLENTNGGERLRKSEYRDTTNHVQQPGEQTNAAGDIVNLSSEANKLQQLKSMLENVPDEREERVRSIKEQIDKGEYEINSDKIADGIIRENILDHLL